MNNIKVIKKGINVRKVIKQLEKYSDDWYIQRKGTDTLLERGYADIEGNESGIVDPGTLLWFNNKMPHGTVNLGEETRVTFVFDMPHGNN